MMTAVSPLAGPGGNGVVDRFASVLDCSPDGIALIERDIVLYANFALASLLDASSTQEIVGKSLGDVCPELDRQCLLLQFQPALRAPQTVSEFVRTRRDGGDLHVEAACTSFLCDGRSLLMLHLRDITDREQCRGLHKTACQLHSIFHAMALGVVQCAQDGRIVAGNPAIERIFGCPRNDLIGRHLQSFFP
jgi:PAS domain S-box-containing protein